MPAVLKVVAFHVRTTTFFSTMRASGFWLGFTLLCITHFPLGFFREAFCHNLGDFRPSYLPLTCFTLISSWILQCGFFSPFLASLCFLLDSSECVLPYIWVIFNTSYLTPSLLHSFSSYVLQKTFDPHLYYHLVLLPVSYLQNL
jgi:hypothetical protein